MKFLTVARLGSRRDYRIDWALKTSDSHWFVRHFDKNNVYHNTFTMDKVYK